MVARVGERTVTRGQLELRVKHVEVYYPKSATEETALAQLVEGYVAEEVLRHEGQALDRAALEAEAARIERDTKDRATLERMKAVYSGRREEYLFVGLLPDFARSRLFQRYRGEARFAEGARAQASAFLDQVEKAPARFAEEARREGVEVRRWKADPGSHEEGEAARVMLERIAGLREGAVHPRTLESDESFTVVRLVKRLDAGAAELEIAAFPKPDFSAWFWRQAKGVPVRVADAELREKFKKRVGWASELDLR